MSYACMVSIFTTFYLIFFFKVLKDPTNFFWVFRKCSVDIFFNISSNLSHSGKFECHCSFKSSISRSLDVPYNSKPQMIALHEEHFKLS